MHVATKKLKLYMWFAFAAHYLLDVDLENLSKEWKSLTKSIFWGDLGFLSMSVEQCSDTTDTQGEQVSFSNTAALRNLFATLRRNKKPKMFFQDSHHPEQWTPNSWCPSDGTEALRKLLSLIDYIGTVYKYILHPLIKHCKRKKS